MDSVLLETFESAVDEMKADFSRQDVEVIHNKLIWKIYNARCNEFLRSIAKLSCIQQKKSVDASIGLRDKLKVYAIEKLSVFNNQ